MAAEPDANVRTTERGVSKPRTAVLRQLRGHASRRLGWGLADQVVSSLTNYAVGIYVVHALGAVQFGAFSLAYVTYAFALNASRGLATDPLMVRFSGTDLPTWRRAVTDCTGTAAVMGLVTGACVVAAAGVLSGVVGSAFLALGLTLPGLLLQDSWRYSFFALGRGSRAFVNDTVLGADADSRPGSAPRDPSRGRVLGRFRVGYHGDYCRGRRPDPGAGHPPAGWRTEMGVAAP